MRKFIVILYYTRIREIPNKWEHTYCLLIAISVTMAIYCMFSKE